MTWYQCFWFDLLFEGHRGQSSKRHQYWHVSLAHRKVSYYNHRRPVSVSGTRFANSQYKNDGVFGSTASPEPGGQDSRVKNARYDCIGHRVTQNPLGIPANTWFCLHLLCILFMVVIDNLRRWVSFEKVFVIMKWISQWIFMLTHILLYE
jgi:hypothetical protein